MLRLDNMGKTQLMGVELPVCHLNKGLLEMGTFPRKGILLQNVLSQKMYKILVHLVKTEKWVHNNVLKYVIKLLIIRLNHHSETKKIFFNRQETR